MNPKGGVLQAESAENKLRTHKRKAKQLVDDVAQKLKNPSTQSEIEHENTESQLQTHAPKNRF